MLTSLLSNSFASIWWKLTKSNIFFFESQELLNRYLFATYTAFFIVSYQNGCKKYFPSILINYLVDFTNVVRYWHFLKLNFKTKKFLGSQVQCNQVQTPQSSRKLAICWILWTYEVFKKDIVFPLEKRRNEWKLRKLLLLWS